MQTLMNNASGLTSVQLESLSILLVDDDEFVLDFVEDMLLDMGMKSVSRALYSSRQSIAYSTLKV
jgi:CheY-like chemotaxis protein